MKFCFFVNDLATELHTYTTTRFALEACKRGHEAWYVGAGDFACDHQDQVCGHAYRVPPDASDLPAVLAGIDDDRELVTIDDFDVLMLRNDPADDVQDRPWAQAAGVLFGELAAQRGVVVLNDPLGMTRAATKLYLEHLPSAARPETLVTRNVEDIRRFVDRHDGRAVLKPLQGSGGQGVFLVHPEDVDNLAQMVDVLARDGYLAAQQYLPDAADGDVRLFLLDGRPLERDGVVAAFRRVPAEGEARSNMKAGGTPVATDIDDDIRNLVELIRPQLLKDGMFFVGLDIVDGRLLEVNAFSPGGLGSAERITGVDFTPTVIDAVELKVRAS